MKKQIKTDAWVQAFTELGKIKPATRYTGRTITSRISGKELLDAGITEFKELVKTGENTVTVVATTWYSVVKKEEKDYHKTVNKIKNSSKTLDEFNKKCAELYRLINI